LLVITSASALLSNNLLDTGIALEGFGVYAIEPFGHRVFDARSGECSMAEPVGGWLIVFSYWLAGLQESATICPFGIATMSAVVQFVSFVSEVRHRPPQMLRRRDLSHTFPHCAPH
jgi:hypothetical protein